VGFFATLLFFISCHIMEYFFGTYWHKIFLYQNLTLSNDFDIQF